MCRYKDEVRQIIISNNEKDLKNTVKSIFICVNTLKISLGQ